jgi:hypothetical protein
MIRKEKKSLILKLLLFFFSVFFVFPRPVYAYVDPGTGSYIIQLVLGFVFGGLFAVKLYWGKIKQFFSNPSKKEKRKDKE